MRKRWWMFRPIDWLCACLPRRRGGGLLIIRMDGIGDMALFQPYATAYAQALGYTPETTTILGVDSWRQLAPRLFPRFRVETLSLKRYEKKFLYRLRMNLHLRRKGYDTVVAPAHFRKIMLHDSLVLATAAPTRIVAKAFRSDRTCHEFDWSEARMTRVIPTGEHPVHECERHQRFLEQLLETSLEPIRKIVDWVGEADALSQDETHVVLNYGSTEPGRNWPVDNYIEIAKRLVADGVMPVFVGGDRETEALPKINAAFAPGEIINLIGTTSLTGLMDVLKAADLVLSNETGPAHLAILVGTPTIMIYGGGHAGSFMPYPADPEFDPIATFLDAPMECYGCLWDCKFPREESDPFHCVASVAIDDVWTAVKQRLASTTSAEATAQVARQHRA